MTGSPQKRLVTLVSACMTRPGLADFALTEVQVTPEEYDNGLHYALAEQRLLAAGYEEPFVHFAPEEGPAFLLPAVREYLAARHPPGQPEGGATCRS
jgi:hypothetical protein